MVWKILKLFEGIFFNRYVLTGVAIILFIEALFLAAAYFFKSESFFIAEDNIKEGSDEKK